MMMNKKDLQNSSFNLEDFLEEVSKNDNFLKVISLISQNETNYKETDFYKANRIKLMDLVLGYKKWKTISFFSTKGIQDLLNSLDMSTFASLIDEFSDIMYNESKKLFEGIEDIEEIAKTIKDPNIV